MNFDSKGIECVKLSGIREKGGLLKMFSFFVNEILLLMRKQHNFSMTIPLNLHV
jgi:hypothetical protein